MTRFIRVALWGGVLGGAMCSTATAAQTDSAARDYPKRPVRIIVPQTAGASTDFTARLVAQRLYERLGQTFVVDNRPGAGSITGTDLVVKAAPDGHTLLVVASSIAINPALRKDLPFDPVRDLGPITQLASFPNIIVVHPSQPAKSVSELIQLAKSRPGQLNVAHSGIGTGTHLSAELFRSMTGVQWTHIPFKGGAPAITATIGGEVQAMFATMPSALPHVRTGKLRGLAVTTPRRSPSAPDIPSVAEAGVPGYEASPWNGMFAPARTPKPVIARLNREVVAIMRTADMRDRLAHEGAEPVGNTPEEFAAVMKAESAKWAKVIREAGIKPE